MRFVPPSTTTARTLTPDNIPASNGTRPFLIFSQQSSDISSLNSNLFRRDKRCSEFATYREDLTHEQPNESYPLQERHHRHDGPQGSQSLHGRRAGRR